MFNGILINYFIGLVLGFLLEFAYRSIYYRKLVKPFFINANMYGLASVGLFFAYVFKFSFVTLIIFAAVLTTFIEYFTGALYLRFKGVYLWDYSKEPLNYKGIISPRFVMVWVIISLAYFYIAIPLIFKLTKI